MFGLFRPRRRSYSPRRHAAERGSLPNKLRWLRSHAESLAPHPRLRDWATRNLSLSPPEIDAWSRRAWWGVAAGELVRVHLYDRDRREEALHLVEHADWGPIDAALTEGGVIAAAAHLGPPKFVMNVLIDRVARPMILTNTNDMPSWLPEIAGPLLNPIQAEDRSRVMVEAALHVREGGLLFAAPDGGFSASHWTVQDFGREWRLSTGLPALARAIGAPSATLLALWRGERIEIRAHPIPRPDPNLPKDAWIDAWASAYWASIRDVIATSPENLRFLAPPFRKEFGT